MRARCARVLGRFFLLAACTAAVSCARHVLEAKEVANFSVVETSASTAPTLKLSGLAMHSAMTVSDIVVETKGDSAVVLVNMTSPPARTGSGSFDFVYRVPDDVNAVYLGRDRTAVWKRGVGPLVPAQAGSGRR